MRSGIRKRTTGMAAAMAAGALAFALGGCGHEHEHGEGHDHGHAQEHGGHAHQASRGGVLVELGDHVASAEVLLDAEAGRLDLWLMDGCAEETVRSKQKAIVVRFARGEGEEPLEVTLQPQASQLSGETAGDTSHFATESEALRGLGAPPVTLEGTIERIEVLGKVFESVGFALGTG